MATAGAFWLPAFKPPYVFLELPAMVSGFADIDWITSAFIIYDFPVGLRTDFLPANTPETGRIYLILPIDGELTIVASWKQNFPWEGSS